MMQLRRFDRNQKIVGRKNERPSLTIPESMQETCEICSKRPPIFATTSQKAVVAAYG